MATAAPRLTFEKESDNPITAFSDTSVIAALDRFKPDISYPDVPCSITTDISKVEEDAASARSAYNNDLQGRKVLPKLRAVHYDCEHPARYPEQGHWRQLIRNGLRLGDYGTDIADITARAYEQGKEEDDDALVIYGPGEELDRAKLIEMFQRWNEEYAPGWRVDFRVYLLECDVPLDESAGMPAGCAGWIRLGADGNPEWDGPRGNQDEVDEDADIDQEASAKDEQRRVALVQSYLSHPPAGRADHQRELETWGEYQEYMTHCKARGVDYDYALISRFSARVIFSGERTYDQESMNRVIAANPRVANPEAIAGNEDARVALTQSRRSPCPMQPSD